MMNHIFDDLTSISPHLAEKDSIPLTAAPPFPWNDLSQKLQNIFEQNTLTISPLGTKWRSKDELLENLGNQPHITQLTIPNLHGKGYWLIPSQEVNFLISTLLTKETDTATALQDPQLINSFYQFILLEALYQLNQTDFDPNLTPILSENSQVPQEDALTCDIQIHFQNRNLHARLLIDQSLRKSLVNYFTNTSDQAAPRADIDVAVQVIVGRTKLTVNEWNEVKLGDFLLIENCKLDKDTLNGPVKLAVNGKNIFNADLNDGLISIEHTEHE